MTPETEAKIMADTAAAWKQTNISVILSEMERYGVTLDELTAYWHNDYMVNSTRTQTQHQPSGNTVAGE